MSSQPEPLPTVDIIASGYEWVCPTCQKLNDEIEVRKNFTCINCDQEVEVYDHLHAYK